MSCSFCGTQMSGRKFCSLCGKPQASVGGRLQSKPRIEDRVYKAPKQQRQAYNAYYRDNARHTQGQDPAFRRDVREDGVKKYVPPALRKQMQEEEERYKEELKKQEEMAAHPPQNETVQFNDVLADLQVVSNSNNTDAGPPGYNGME